MSRGHPCIGGPLDGQVMIKQDHVKQFFVALAPDIKAFTLFAPDDTHAAVNTTIKTVTYTLTRNAAGGLDWVCA